MNQQTTGNAKPQQIQKCPYYDPITRETVKPGKTCPNYNSVKGCPYAHPFQTEKWDGENSLDALVAAAPSSAIPSMNSASNQERPIKPSGPENASERMDLDDNSARQSGTLELVQVQQPDLAVATSGSELAMASTDPFSLLSQKEAVETFLTHIIASLHAYRCLNDASSSLNKFKSLYKRYSELEPQGLAVAVPPGTNAAWLEERKRKYDVTEEARGVARMWLGGLASLGEGEKSSIPLLGDGQDTAMAEATAVSLRSNFSKEDLVVQALNQHRSRVSNGAVGATVVELRTRLEKLRANLQARIRTGTMIVPERKESVDGDIEMKDQEPEDHESPPDNIKKDIRRLEDLLTDAEDALLHLDQAERWGTASMEDEWYSQDLRSAISRITLDYLSQPSDEEDTQAPAEGAPPIQRPSVVSKMKKTLEEVEGIRDTSQTLERILGPVPSFELRNIPLRSAEIVPSSNAELANTLNSVDQISSQRNSLLHSDRYAILQKMISHHKQKLGALLLKEVQPFSLLPRFPSQQEIINDSEETWNREFEALKEQMSRIVSPLAERTDAQEARLMSFGAERRGGASGLGVRGSDGGLVSTQVSVQGAMG